MAGPDRLADLQSRVAIALRDLPGATALYLYGSAADPARRDAYSDLDLQVLTLDFQFSKDHLLATLEKVGAVALAYLLTDTAHELAYSITFAGESPYHKVDLGITCLNDPAHPPTFFEQIRDKQLLWSQSAPSPVGVNFPTLSIRQPYCPTKASPAYFLVGEIISALRYAKARRRGRHLVCWRFLSAKVNALLALAWWQDSGGDRIPERLSTWDLAELDERLPQSVRLEMLQSLDCRQPAQMDQALLEITRRMVALLRPSLSGPDQRAIVLGEEGVEFIAQELN
jgi:hypothetical protein